MQVTIIPIVIGAFGTVTKGLLKGLEDLKVGGRVETIQTTTLLSFLQSFSHKRYLMVFQWSLSDGKSLAFQDSS